VIDLLDVDTKQWLTVPGVCERTEYTVRQIRRWVQLGYMPSQEHTYRGRRRILVTVEDAHDARRTARLRHADTIIRAG
jgi:hypothetical protein